MKYIITIIRSTNNIELFKFVRHHFPDKSFMDCFDWINTLPHEIECDYLEKYKDNLLRLKDIAEITCSEIKEQHDYVQEQYEQTQEEQKIKYEKAMIWYNTLSSEEQKNIDILVEANRPVS